MKLYYKNSLNTYEQFIANSFIPIRFNNMSQTTFNKSLMGGVARMSSGL